MKKSYSIREVYYENGDRFGFYEGEKLIRTAPAKILLEYFAGGYIEGKRVSA